MEENLPKMCQTVSVYSGRVVCAENESVLGLCLLSTIEFLTPSTVCPKLVISSRREAAALCAGTEQPNFIHWMSHSFHSLPMMPHFRVVFGHCCYGDNA